MICSFDHCTGNNDTQLSQLIVDFIKISNVPFTVDYLQVICVTAVVDWGAAGRLQLNLSKMKLIYFG